MKLINDSLQNATIQTRSMTNSDLKIKRTINKDRMIYKIIDNWNKSENSLKKVNKLNDRQLRCINPV